MATATEKSHSIRDFTVRTLKIAIGTTVFGFVLVFIMLFALSAAG